MAMVQAWLITPHPITAMFSADALLRYLAATPGTAPVLAAESRLADIIAIGAPVSASFNENISIERGMPFFMFSTFDPYHFWPVT